MNKTLLSSALVVVIAATAFAPSAQAASGTINFTGKVLADSCVITVNNSTTSTVALPTVMKSAFTAVGSTAGDTTFAIALKSCDTNTTSATVAFSSGTNVDSTTGNLKNATAGGSDVQIQLRNSSSAIINTASNVNAPAIAIDNTGAGSTTLTAQYVATAAATKAGLVTSSVGFTLTYL